MSLEGKQKVKQHRDKPGNHTPSEIRRRNSTVREKNLCLATLRLTRQIAGSNRIVTTRAEAILDFWVIEDQLWQLTYAVHELRIRKSFPDRGWKRSEPPLFRL